MLQNLVLKTNLSRKPLATYAEERMSTLRTAYATGFRRKGNVYSSRWNGSYIFLLSIVFFNFGATSRTISVAPQLPTGTCGSWHADYLQLHRFEGFEADLTLPKNIHRD